MGFETLAAQKEKSFILYHRRDAYFDWMNNGVCLWMGLTASISHQVLTLLVIANTLAKRFLCQLLFNYWLLCLK